MLLKMGYFWLHCSSWRLPLSPQPPPLTIENCGVKQTFTQAPQRVVTVGQHETELLLALGLEKTIAATSVWFGKLPAPLEDAGKTSPACR